MSKDEMNIADDFVEIDNPVSEAERKADEQEKKQLEQQKEAIEAIKRFTDDEDEDEFGRVSFKTIMGGDILQSKFFLNQVIFIIFCVILLLLYTGNRYSSLQDIIRIDSLNAQFTKIHYEVLTQSSHLLNKQRQSNVEAKLLQVGDTAMTNNNTPPFALPHKEE